MPVNNDLREKMKSAISLWALNGSELPSELADDILAMPEIAEALAERERQRAIAARNAEAKKAMRPAPLGHSIKVR